nr:MAG TPA: hypothetical protein [Caudoviricetes sp.]
MNKDLMLLNDNECDNLLGAFLAKGFEDEEYISPVEAMYGIGIESAFVDDGFFAKLKRGIRNLTTFRQGSKIANAISDIKNLSVEKIAQGDTRGVTFDGKSIEVLNHVVNTRVANLDKVNSQAEELNKLIDEISQDEEMLAVFKAVNIDVKKMGIIRPLVKSGIAESVVAGTMIAGLKELFREGGIRMPWMIGYGVIIVAGSVVGFIQTFKFYRAIYLRFKSKPKNELTDAERRALDAVGRISELSVNGIKTLLGVNVTAANIEKELENAAKRDKLAELKSVLSNKSKTVSYDDKVKIVQTLQGISENEDKVKSAFDLNSLKKSFDAFMKYDKDMQKVGISVGEASLVQKNANAVFAYANSITNLIIESIAAILDDCKRY